MNAAPHASRIVIDACPLCGSTTWSLHCRATSQSQHRRATSLSRGGPATSQSRGSDNINGPSLDVEGSLEAEWVRCQCGLVFKHREAIEAGEAHGNDPAAD